MGDDLATLAALVAHHRARLGLSPNKLATRSFGPNADYIRDIECGLRRQLRPSMALRLAEALELDDWETDRFLYLAGCAPVLDWQALALEVLDDLGLADLLRDRARVAYAQLRTKPTPKETT